jgi:hypothetical protein
MRIAFFIVLSFLATPTFACGPAMHAYLGNLWLDAHHVTEPINRKEFIIGTLFPDIRYMGKVQRSQTHAKKVNLALIDKTPDYFKKGMLFHAYVDDQQEDFTNKSTAYRHLPKDIKTSRSIFIELIADEIIFDLDWIKPISTDINTVIAKEKILGLSEIDLYPWHMLLHFYFSSPPSQNLKQLSILNIDAAFLTADMIKIWSLQLPEMKKSAYYQTYTQDLISLFRRQLFR